MTICRAIKGVLALAIFTVVVSLIELLIFHNDQGVAIGITTGIISGFIVLIFQMGILHDQPLPTPTNLEPSIPLNDQIRARQIQRVEFELKIDKLYLTAIGLAFTVESVFIGLYGKALLSGVFDMQFAQIAGISFLFIIFLIVAWCDYQNKMRRVEELFR
jgi:hypothetical protein